MLCQSAFHEGKRTRREGTVFPAGQDKKVTEESTSFVLNSLFEVFGEEERWLQF